MAAVPDLLGGDSDADADGSALKGPLKERPVPAADVQQSVAGLNTASVQQVIILVYLGLLKRQIGVTIVDPLGQVEQAASREESIDCGITGDDRPPRLNARHRGIGQYLRIRHAQSSQPSQ